MPVYGSNTPPTIPVLKTPVVLFARELVSNGTQSIQVVLPPNPVGPKCYSLEFAFTDVNGNPSNPGGFQLDVLHADTDVAASYVTAKSITSGLNSSYAGRVEMVNVVAKLMSVQLVSKTNVVYLTVTANRGA